MDELRGLQEVQDALLARHAGDGDHESVPVRPNSARKFRRRTVRSRLLEAFDVNSSAGNLNQFAFADQSVASKNPWSPRCRTRSRRSSRRRDAAAAGKAGRQAVAPNDLMKSPGESVDRSHDDGARVEARCVRSENAQLGVEGMDTTSASTWAKIARSGARRANRRGDPRTG